IPRSVRQKANLLEGAFSRIEQELGRAASDEEVARELGMSLEEFQKFLSQSAGLALLSLDDLVDPTNPEDSRSLLDHLASLDEDDPQAKLAFEELKRILGQSIDALPQRERLVLSLYYHEELTMKEVGQILDVTESRVSQLHSKAIARVRVKLKRLVGEKP
ncbi:MAG: sigma-70 family RNA polymerase sigma factor, partial [Candidatus Tectomicrobia bacterium]|nr:sigma-70 family RNA polymerase sigma factor [Candidatus Tectomicrobia bacterium]